MATLADLRTYLARDLRDTGNDTWSVAELDDLINQGIDALADVYPKEIVQTLGTIAANTYSYAASSFSNIYRLDVYTSAGTFRGQLDAGFGGGANGGWELHGGVVYLPPSRPLTVGDTIRAFGYGRYIQLSAATATTDLSTEGIFAVRVFAQSEAYARMIADRVKTQQWQANANAMDTTALALAQIAGSAARRWEKEKARLRRLRKTG